MARLQFLHTPGYGQFYIQDPKAFDQLATSRVSRTDIESNRFFVGDGIIAVFVKSEISEIPIEFEVLSQSAIHSFDSWDRVVELSLNIGSGQMALVGCPDGPEYGTFAASKLEPGPYRVRVHYGGQSLLSDDGNTKDYYLIEVWPQAMSAAVVLKF